MEEMMMESVETPEVEVNEQVVEKTSSEGQPEPQEQTPEDPYSPKSSSEYAKWLKSLRDSDPANGKFARMAKDDHSRLFQLKQMEPRGIDGVREKYALLESIQHGEVKGVDALAAMQDELRSVQEIDERLFSGDAEALKEMGDEFITGALPKLAGPILDMVRSANPEAYAAAVLPHVVEALRQGPVIANFSKLGEILNENMPSWLPEDKKAAWTADKFQRIINNFNNMADAFNALQEKSAALKPVDPTKANGSKGLNEERQTFEKERQEHHWKTNISPKLDQHASTKFQELFRPYGMRLKLDATAKNGLMMEFSKRVSQQATKNQGYMDQIKRYRAQKNPDPGAVINYAKVEFDKHAQNVMKDLIKERYNSFLSGKPQNSQQNQTGNRQTTQNKGPVGPNVQIVSVKPASQDINWRATNPDMIHQKKYVLNNGKIVQVRQ